MRTNLDNYCVQTLGLDRIENRIDFRLEARFAGTLEGLDSEEISLETSGSEEDGGGNSSEEAGPEEVSEELSCEEAGAEAGSEELASEEASLLDWLVS